MGNCEQVTLVQCTAIIRQINDRLRQRHEGGRVVLSDGVRALPVGTVARILIAIRDAGPPADHSDEHDAGRVLVDGHEVLWVIDAFGLDWISHSPDPSEPSLTCRRLSVLLVEEAGHVD